MGHTHFGNDGNNKVTNRISAGLDTSKYVQSNGSETVESGARLGISAGQTRILTADDKKSIYTFVLQGFQVVKLLKQIVLVKNMKGMELQVICQLVLVLFIVLMIREIQLLMAQYLLVIIKI